MKNKDSDDDGGMIGVVLAVVAIGLAGIVIAVALHVMNLIAGRAV